MREIMKGLQNKESIRYLIAGGLTTLVDLVVFFVLRELLHMNLNASNFISIAAAILFAYGINKFYVFQSKTKGIEAVTKELMSFLGARVFTMLVQMIGVAVLAEGLHVPDMISKLLLQVIVLVLNYVLGKMFVFKDKVLKGTDKDEKFSLLDWAYDKRIHLLAFLIPLALLIVVEIIYGIQPFGDRSLVIIDGLHQYMPFFSEYRNKLLTGQSLLYSWNGGLGLNFLSLWAYYLSSPLNLIIVFFKQEHLNGVISFLIILKMALSGLTMSIYLEKSQVIIRGKGKQINALSLMFSVFYALSNFMIGYSWNVMWLDSIMLFPLILLGVEYLIKKNDGRLYCVTLFLSLFCNFYISFMICLFLIIYFLLFRFDSFGQFVRKGFIFAGYSLLAGALAAVVLIPTYNGIMMTSSATSSFPEPMFYRSFIDIITAHTMITRPITNMQNDGGVNLYCGLFTILLVNLYLLNGRIPKSVRIKNVIIVLFLLLSFNQNVLNYIWHGFHDQYGIPNRFAFIYIFMLLVMAYQVLIHIKGYSRGFIIWSYGVSMGSLILSSVMAEEPASMVSYGVTGGVLILYTVVLLRYRNRQMTKRFFRYLIVSLVMLEVTVSTIYGYSQIGQVQISRYFSDTQQMNEMKQVLANDTGFYRTELQKARMLDEVTWHNLKGINLFGSTAIGEVVYTMGRFGFYSAANEYLYKGATPVTDSILGVKYLILRDGDPNYSNFEFQETISGIDIYMNNHPLPIGFMVRPEVKDVEYRINNPFTVQNNFVEMTMKDPVKIFNPIFVNDPTSTNGCEVTRTGEGSYSFERTETLEDNVVFTIIPYEDQDMYLFVTGNQIENMLIKNGEEIRANEKLNSRVIHVGDVKGGVQVTISMKLKNDKDAGNINVMAASFDEQAFQEYYNSLADEPFEVTDYSSTRLEGTVTAQEDGLLFTSIPFDRGWSVTVDGVEIPKDELEATADAFLSFNLAEGEHNVVLEYKPAGLYLGFGLSGGALVLFLGICFVFHRKKGEETTSDDEKSEEETQI